MLVRQQGVFIIMKGRIVFMPKNHLFFTLCIIYSIGLCGITFCIIEFALKSKYLFMGLCCLAEFFLLLHSIEILNYRIKITKNYIVVPIPNITSRFCRYKFFKKQKIFFHEMGEQLSELNFEEIKGLNVMIQRRNPFKIIRITCKNGDLKEVDIYFFTDKQVHNILKVINERIKESRLKNII